MDANDTYEELAKRFSKDTGLLAPGKDAPAAVGGDPDYNTEYRRKVWDEWIRKQQGGKEMR